jgi:hypothetical protein
MGMGDGNGDGDGARLPEFQGTGQLYGDATDARKCF